jgi:hypothetical protein
VIITFLDEQYHTQMGALDTADEDWEAFGQMIESCAIETGIADLAHRHDDYLHHTSLES